MGQPVKDFVETLGKRSSRLQISISVEGGRGEER
jgi:hypothetical protein